MRQQIIEQVELEFGEPFWDVVRGFASDGYASGTTAKILGFSGQDVFRRLQRSAGVEIKWPAHGQCNAMKEPRGEYSEERTMKRLATMGLSRRRKSAKSNECIDSRKKCG